MCNHEIRHNKSLCVYDAILFNISQEEIKSSTSNKSQAKASIDFQHESQVSFNCVYFPFHFLNVMYVVKLFFFFFGSKLPIALLQK